MALLNQKCFSPQSLSCSYHGLTSMQMGLVVICSTSISHNFGLKSPITTSQAFFYVPCNELIHMAHLHQKCFSPQSLSCSYRRLTSMQMAWLRFVQIRLAITLVWKVRFWPVKHFCVACNELNHMALLNQKCFSPQSLSCSYHRLTSMQMGLVVICSSSISHIFSLESPITTSQAFLCSL